MVDYQFYKSDYLGSAIPETVFPEMAARAEEALQRFERIYLVSGGEAARSMALCAMAETLYKDARRAGVSQQSVGSVSVRYEGGSTLQRRLLQKAAIFLDICRGVG